MLPDMIKDTVRHVFNILRTTCDLTLARWRACLVIALGATGLSICGTLTALAFPNFSSTAFIGFELLLSGALITCVTALQRMIFLPRKHPSFRNAWRFGWPEVTYFVLLAIVQWFSSIGLGSMLLLFQPPFDIARLTGNLIWFATGLFAMTCASALAVGLPFLALDRKCGWATVVSGTRGYRLPLFICWSALTLSFQLLWAVATDLIMSRHEIHTFEVEFAAGTSLSALVSQFYIMATAILTSASAVYIFGDRLIAKNVPKVTSSDSA